LAYETIISADSIEDFENQATSRDLPPGTKVKIRIELPAWAPIGVLADMFGAEWVASRFVPAEMVVDDVYGSWRWVEITGTVYGTPVLILVTVIVGMLAALGIAYFASKIVLSGELPKISTPLSLAAIAGIAMGVAGIIFLTRRKV
jgi:hypothetical protein